MRARLPLAAAGCLAFTLAPLGCGDGAHRDTVVRRDSAGVRIVETADPMWAAGESWTVDPVPVLDLAEGSGPEHEFHRVSSATVLHDGSIAVANAGSSEIRLFSASAEFIAKYGRAGEGPGEFSRLRSVHRAPGDSLVGWDFWLGRITVFALDGSGVRTVTLPPALARVNDIAVRADNVVIANAYDYGEITGPGMYRVTYSIVRADAELARIDTIARVPGFEGYQFEHGDARPLFARLGHFAVRADRVFVGDADSLEIRVLDDDGGLVMIMRVPGHDLRLTADDLAAERTALMPPADAPASRREPALTMPDRETRPAYSDLLVDELGFVWAPEHHAIVERDDPTDCFVFGPDGEWLGTVRLPARFTVFEVGSDHVLGVRRDGNDVEHVQMLRLARR